MFIENPRMKTWLDEEVEGEKESNIKLRKVVWWWKGTQGGRGSMENEIKSVEPDLFITYNFCFPWIFSWKLIVA